MRISSRALLEPDPVLGADREEPDMIVAEVKVPLSQGDHKTLQVPYD
jgi:hypothetical protein